MMIFTFDVGIVQSLTTKRRKINFAPLPPHDIGQHFGKLLETGEKTDVKFEVGGEQFSAHMLVLATRSPVFNAQFYGPLNDQNAHIIKIEGIEAPIFKALLHFIYWDELPDFKNIVSNSSVGACSIWMFQHLLVAADRYYLHRLKLLCVGKLCDKISIDDVAMSLAVADQCGESLLKTTCIEFVALPGHLQAVRKTEGFKNLKISCPALCLELLEYVAGIQSSKFPAEKEETYFDVIRRKLGSFFRNGVTEGKKFLLNDCQAKRQQTAALAGKYEISIDIFGQKTSCPIEVKQ